jgi:small GTP-binding protein
MTEQLRYQIDALQEIAAGVADPPFFADLDELREKLRQGRINLVVLGLFKRGKSSLVNSLLGCSLAPVGVTPLTAIVTSFEHDPDRSFARIYFRDGRHIDTGVAEITQYVSEEENPGNEKDVSVVRLFDRVLPVLKTMTLIDTPGLGSAHTHNTATTLEFVPRIDAALFVLSADLPISQADIEFLKTLKDNVPTILFVLNKKDLLDEPDLRKLIAHNRKIISDQVGLGPDAVEIIPVSARQHQQGRIAVSNMGALNQQIRLVMENNNEILLRQTTARRISKLCSRLDLLLRTRMEALQLPLQELVNRQQQLHKIPDFLESRKEDFEHAIKGQTTRLQEQVRRAMQDQADQLRKELPDKLDLLTHAFPGNPSDQGNQLSEWILGTLERTRSSLERTIKTRFESILHQYAQEPDSFLAAVVHQLSAVIGVDFGLIADKFDLDVYSPFYMSLGAGPIPAKAGFMTGLLPRTYRERRFKRRLLAYYDEIIVRNAAAVIYNLDYRIQESLRKFSTGLRQRLHELASSLEALLTDTIGLHADYEARVDEKFGEVRDKLLQLKNLRETQTPIVQPPIPNAT